jgi:hypothetical protein
MTWVLALALPAALAGVATLVVPAGGAGFSATSIRVSVLVILGVAALGALVGSVEGRSVMRELLGIVAGGTAVFFLSGGGKTGPTVAALAVTAWGVPWGWSLVPRRMGFLAGGRVVLLAGAALLLGTPWLVPPSWSRVPDWVLDLNPLARLHGSTLGEDWLHGPTLYPRIGEGYYIYPDPLEGLFPLILTGVGAAAVAWGIGFARGCRAVANDSPRART